MTATEEMQTTLKKFGYYTGEVDDDIGPLTKRAVAEWLANPNGHVTTGIDRTDWRGYKPVNQAKLIDILPEQARPLVPSFLVNASIYNLNPLFLVAISKHETGNWTSNVFRTRGNAMGISNSQSAVSVSSHDESIRVAARSLGRPGGFYSGCKTLADVSRVYAPVGAANDPTSVNHYWPDSVAKYWQELETAIAA